MAVRNLGNLGRGSLAVDDGGSPSGTVTLMVTAAGANPVATQEAGPANATLVSVAPATGGTAFILRNANADRRGLTLKNTSGQILYVSLGATVPTAALHTAEVAAGGYYEVPFSFRGTVRGLVAANGTGAVSVTELTA